jgi:hypothetical protein
MTSLSFNKVSPFVFALTLASALSACGQGAYIPSKGPDVQAAAAKVESLHWVGGANIYASKSSYFNPEQRRAYSNQLMSVKIVTRPEGKRLYVEVGTVTTNTFKSSEEGPALVGLPTRGRDAVSTDVDAFLAGEETRLTVGDFYLVGSLEKGLDSKFSGRIYEKGNNIFAGYFRFEPRHDGADSIGYNMQDTNRDCFPPHDPTAEQLAALPPQCFGPGAP